MTDDMRNNEQYGALWSAPPSGEWHEKPAAQDAEPDAAKDASEDKKILQSPEEEEQAIPVEEQDISLEEQTIPAEDPAQALALKLKRAKAKRVIAGATTAAVVVGAVPIPIADAMILTPMEVMEINAIAKAYGISEDETSQRLFSLIVEFGTVSIAARAAISALKAIPGINLGVSALNAIIAGSIVLAIGRGSAYVFEQIYLGTRTAADLQWVSAYLEKMFSEQFIAKCKCILEVASNGGTPKENAKLIVDAFFPKPGEKESKKK